MHLVVGRRVLGLLAVLWAWLGKGYLLVVLLLVLWLVLWLVLRLVLLVVLWLVLLLVVALQGGVCLGLGPPWAWDLGRVCRGVLGGIHAPATVLPTPRLWL